MDNSNMNNYSLVKSLEENINMFKSIFSKDGTLIVRRFENKTLKGSRCCAIYFDGMVESELVNESIIKPILHTDLTRDISSGNLLQELQYKVIVSNEAELIKDVNEILGDIVYGDTLLLVDGYEEALVINTKGWKVRSISEPQSAKIVRGPREGFTESIIINISMVRRKIKSPNLKLEFKEIGVRTQTRVCICYIEGLALEEILKELNKRINEINIDGILDSGYIQELIKDAPFSPFETVGYTERPDIIAGKLLEGRIAIFVDGSPFVLTVPFVLAEGFQANEDYYNNYIFGSINRFLRASAMVLSMGIPALFLALVTYHQEMLPTPLLISISASRQGVPLPTVLSLIFMLIVFDVLREAGTRMPTPIGQAINIVGTLVLGQAIVEAKFVSSPVIIITALTGILTLMNITLLSATIIIRMFLILLSSFLGVYGFIFGIIAVVLHVLSIRSFGIPYMLNLTSVKNHNGQDIWIRAPWWSMTLRPKLISAKNMVRQKTSAKGGRK